MFSAGGGCEIAVSTCVKTAWKKFRELLPVLTSRHLSYKTQLLFAERHASCKWNLATDQDEPAALATQWYSSWHSSRHSSCLQSAMLLASETWPLTKTNLQRLQRNDRAMIRQSCSIKPDDMASVRSSKLLAKLQLEDLDPILRERRLCWFGHVEHSNGAIRTACDIQIEIRRGAGRPELTW